MIDKKEVNRVFSHLAHPADYEYFFDSINSPEWIKPLHEKGCFRSPPQPNRSEGYIQFPFWAESRFLARMADKSTKSEIQKLIVDVALAIPDTDNVRVHEDLVDIALSVAPSLGKKLVPKLLKCLESPYQLLLPNNLGPLIKKLAEAGEEDDAFRLAEHTLKIIPANKADGKAVGRQRLVDRYYYNEILKKVVTPLSELNSERAFCLFFRLLKAALDSKYGKDKPYSDYSYMWRPAIEESEYNRYEHGIKFHLVDAVRTTAEIWAGKDSSKVPEIIKQLETGKWTILGRIALYFLRLFPEADLNATKSKISDISLYDDLDYRYEYFCLANQHAGLLTEEERQEIYKEILVGPDIDVWKERAKALGRPIPSEAELEKGKKMWVRDHLSIFKRYFDSNTSKAYETLVREVGEPPEDVALPVQHEGVWVGPTSPKTPQELQELSVEELIKFLAEWKPSKDWRSPTPEGLGRALTETIKKDINKYVGKLHLFEGLDPTYVRSVIYGYQEAEFEGSEKLWTDLLELCSWVVVQPAEISGRKKSDFDRDSSWDSCRQWIANLLKTGFSVGKSVIPFAMREKAFQILIPLTEDSDPTPERDDKGNDPHHVAINSVRGVAMEALVAYALWVKRNLLSKNAKLNSTDIGFLDMPEVKKVLDYHLDTEKDPVLAIRSIYGASFHNLRYLDSQWVDENKDIIFPIKNVGEVKYFDAGWTAYIVFGRFDTSYYEALEKQYRFFAEHIQSGDFSSWYEGEVVEEHYADQLMIFYLNGIFPLDDALLTGFLEKATSRVRAHIMWQVGHWVTGEKEMPSDLHDRYTNFWRSRLEQAKASDNLSVYEEELNNFGLWAKSTHLKPEWVLEQIHEVVRLIGKITPDYQVAEFMEEHAEVDMQKSLECIERIFKGDKEGWGAYTWIDPTKKILKTAFKSPNQLVKDKAESLRNWLIAKGYREFRTL